MTKRAVIQVRVSVEEKAAWERFAAAEGLSLSELIRRLMLGGLPKVVIGPVPYRDLRDPVPESIVEEARRNVIPAGLPSAVQVAKRPFKSDFK
jgi:hypothetical protein